MIERKMELKDIKEVVFPHPSISEIIREGIFQIDSILGSEGG
ncbi:hypothetical protein [Acetivibrio straminisolvens]|nr:hypothetical protein [Acetivibrio straminisolvens]